MENKINNDDFNFVLNDELFDINIKLRDNGNGNGNESESENEHFFKFAIPKSKTLIYRKNDKDKLDQRKTWKIQSRENENIKYKINVITGKIRSMLLGNKYRKLLIERLINYVNENTFGTELILKINFEIISNINYTGDKVIIHELID